MPDGAGLEAENIVIARSRRKTPVFLVHGINSNGSWAPDISPVLSHFLEPVVVSYPQFRRLGWLKVILEPWILFGGLVLIGLCWWSSWITPPTTWGLAMVVLLLAFPAARIRRKLAMSQVTRQLGDRFKASPYVVAHSFGTYLLARILIEIRSAYIRRMIFVGSVLSPRWDWKSMPQSLGLDGVRNEWSSDDAVAWAAGIAGHFVQHLGASGSQGFQHSIGSVHRVDDPNLPCTHCVGGQSALVHDVNFSGHGHSDSFLARDHAVRYWLPYFWSIDPAEYWALLDVCRRFSEAVDHGDKRTLRTLEVQLELYDRWSWINDSTLWSELESRIGEARAGRVNRADVARASYVFCVSVGTAVKSDAHDSVLTMLNPYWALSNAVRRVVG